MSVKSDPKLQSASIMNPCLLSLFIATYFNLLAFTMNFKFRSLATYNNNEEKRSYNENSQRP